MNKPFIYAVIVILWIITLVGYLIISRYHVQHDHGDGVASVIDKRGGTVQTIPLDKKDAFPKGPDKAHSEKNKAGIGVKLASPKTMPDVKEGIQNKEP